MLLCKAARCEKKFAFSIKKSKVTIGLDKIVYTYELVMRAIESLWFPET